jgi:aspartate aminotransferase
MNTIGMRSLVRCMNTTPRSLLMIWPEQALCDAHNQALQKDAMPRIMLVNSPSNPTGRVYSEENVAIILRFCKKHGITLISDEIYSDISFGTEIPPGPAAAGQLDHSQMIVTGGLSKVSTW